MTSRESGRSAGHSLFLKNRENLIDLIVRKLKTKHVDKNPYFFAGQTPLYADSRNENSQQAEPTP